MSRLRSEDFSVARAVSRFGHMGGLQKLGAPFRWIQKANLNMGYMRFMLSAVYVSISAGALFLEVPYAQEIDMLEHIVAPLF